MCSETLFFGDEPAIMRSLQASGGGSVSLVVEFSVCPVSLVLVAEVVWFMFVFELML